MSTVDSTFNSIATLFSIDIYKEYINKNATDNQVVSTGRKTILVTLLTGVIMGFILLYVKFENPEDAFTHTLNELRYYINCGIVVLICAAAFLMAPNHRVALLAFISTAPLNLILKHFFPEMNYFVRAGWVITIAFSVLAAFSAKGGWTKWKDLIKYDDRSVSQVGIGLALSLVLMHVIFH